MPFIQLDDQITEHPKILQAGAVAAWVWVSAIAYCQRQLTDGFLPDAALPRLAQEATPKVLTRLVHLRLLDRVDGGYRVHDYLAHNPSRETVLRRRAESAARKERHRGTRDGRVPERVTGHVTDAPSRARIPTPTPTPTPPSSDDDVRVESSPTSGQLRHAAIELLEMWRQHGTGAPTPEFAALSKPEKRELWDALKSRSLDQWTALFQRALASDYLAGRDGQHPPMSFWDVLSRAGRIDAGVHDNRQKPQPVDPYADDGWMPTKLRSGGAA